MLQALEAAGTLDDTLIIFTSDHGDALGDHGLSYKGFFCDSIIEGGTNPREVWDCQTHLFASRPFAQLHRILDDLEATDNNCFPNFTFVIYFMRTTPPRSFTKRSQN